MPTRADASCCLNVAGSINSPYCKILTQREMMMGKKNKKKKKILKNQTECSGKSILEHYWEELDTIMDRLMTEGSEAADGQDKGRAETAAYFIAILENPYNPDIDAVKIQCVDRWNARNEEDLAQEDAIVGGEDMAHGEHPQQADEA